MSYTHPELLAETDWLAEHARDPNVRIIDCAMVEAYRRAHIPGAVHLPVHFYVKEDDPAGSDHGVLVMPPRQFEALMGKLGVGRLRPSLPTTTTTRWSRRGCGGCCATTATRTRRCSTAAGTAG